MIRLLMFLLGKEYETCKSCDTLKQQLAIKNEEVRVLNETLMSLLKPKVYENPAIELGSMKPTALTFTQRRAALEARDRLTAQVKNESKVLGKSDIEQAESIEALEQELEIVKGKS